MAFSLRSFVALLLLCCFICDQLPTVASKKAPKARKEDVKYIKCEVCEEIVKQLNRQVKKKRDDISPKKLSELEIIDIAERICNVAREEGNWIQHLDIVEAGDKLKVVEQASEGECGVECKTIKHACDVIMGDHDTDVAELLYNPEAKRAALSTLLCRTLTSSCSAKPPPVPKSRVPGEAFAPLDSKKAEEWQNTESRKTEDMPGGNKMKMYSRDDMMKKAAMGGMGAADDDDDDDEEVDVDELKEKMQKTQDFMDKYTIKDENNEAIDAGSMFDSVTGTAQQALGKAQETAQQALGKAQETAQHAYEAASKGAQAAKDWVGGLLSKDKEEQKSEL
eukprot:jgi/Mesen1/5850/ME000298S05121